MLTLETLGELLAQHREAARARVAEFTIGARHFAFNSQPALMGVINLSADSWYRESVCLTSESAIERGTILAAQGAAIIDLGAESTLDRAARVDDASQLERLRPVIEQLSAANLLVSVETYSVAVALGALTSGAKILNLTGSRQAEAIYRLAAQHEAAVIICYVEAEDVRSAGDFTLAADPIPKMEKYFAQQLALADQSGVSRIFLDPGLGFYYRNLQDSAVRVRHQITTFLNTFRLRKLGFPICHALPHAFEYFGEEVRTAEAVFAVLASLGRTDLFRTHEVPKVKAVLDLLAVLES